MEEKDELLAWRNFPLPEGLTYTARDLCMRSNVVVLFDYCQILRAAIWAKGWKFLFEQYGLKGIIEIDSESGWLNDDDLGEWIKSIVYWSLISGFDPIAKEFGKYDEGSGLFINEADTTRTIDWQQIYDLKHSL